MTTLTPQEQRDANRAALERGEWVAGEPRQTRALVPVKAPGGVPVKVMKLVYRARMFRRIEARPGHEEDYCPHNHVKKSAAATCGQRAVRRLNKQTAQQGQEEAR